MRLDTNVYTSIIPVTNATIRAGWKFDQGWLPGMAWVSYIQTEFKGTFDLEQRVGTDVDPGSVPPGTSAVRLSFAVAKYDTWAVGGQWKLNKHFVIVSELGFTTLKSLTVALNYRIE